VRLFCRDWVGYWSSCYLRASIATLLPLRPKGGLVRLGPQSHHHRPTRRPVVRKNEEIACLLSGQTAACLPKVQADGRAGRDYSNSLLSVFSSPVPRERESLGRYAVRRTATCRSNPDLWSVYRTLACLVLGNILLSRHAGVRSSLGTAATGALTAWPSAKLEREKHAAWCSAQRPVT